MKTIFTGKLRIILIVLVILVTALGVTFQAGAQTGDDPALTPASPTGSDAGLTPSSPAGGGPVPGGPGYVVVSGFDFRPYDPTDAYSYLGTAINNTGAASAWYIATFQIPNGATINKMVAYYTDSDPGVGQNLDLDMLYCPLFSGCYMMASINPTATISGWVYSETTTITNPVVDLAINSYALQVNLPASNSVWLNAVRIDYGYATALPLLAKP
jgi:hypothetical protein